MSASTDSKPLTWLITGANSGLGLALTKYVLAKGDKVIAATRDTAKLPASITGNDAASALKLDPSAPHVQIVAAANEALAQHGKIDVLVNNAGYSLTGPVEELDAEHIKAQFQTNVFGAISLCQALLPSFRAQRSGQILNFSSVAGFAGGPGFGAYNASKAALDAFTEALAREIAPFNIRALIISPGFFPTNFLATATKTKVQEESATYTGAYTDPAQGFGASERYHGIHVRDRQVGDAEKLAARVYEVVSGTGLARGLLKEGDVGVRVPIGPDSGKRIRAKAEGVVRSVDVLEPVWSSTDMDEEQLKAL